MNNEMLDSNKELSKKGNTDYRRMLAETIEGLLRSPLSGNVKGIDTMTKTLSQYLTKPNEIRLYVDLKAAIGTLELAKKEIIEDNEEFLKTSAEFFTPQGVAVDPEYLSEKEKELREQRSLLEELDSYQKSIKGIIEIL